MEEQQQRQYDGEIDEQQRSIKLNVIYRYVNLKMERRRKINSLFDDQLTI